MPIPFAAWIVRRIAATLVLLLALAGAVWAHASLGATSPADGSVIETAPPVYSLTFSEPVSPLSLKLIGPAGSITPLESSSLKGNVLEIDAPGDLARGTHVLSWRVVSADGHPIGGSFVFSFGEVSTVPPPVQDDVDWAVRSGLWLSRIALYTGLFIGVGGVFALTLLMPGIRGGRGMVLGSIALGLVGAIASTGFQGLDALAAPIGRLTDPVVWSVALETSFGRTSVVALVALLLACAGLALGAPLARLAAALALAGAGLSLASSGHASAATPQWLMRPAVFLHATCIAVWIGALAPLGLSLGAGDPRAIGALRHFSRVIPVFVAILIAGGTVLAIVQVESPAALVDTAYGQVFLVKLLMLAGLFLLVAVNRWTLTAPTAAGDPWATRRLVGSVAVETTLAIAIFAAAAAWRFTPPPRVIAAEARLPTTVQLQSDKTNVVFSVGPAKVGPVDIVVNVLDAGMEPFQPKEVTISLSNPAAGIEPFSRGLERGDGIADWHARQVTMPLAGTWHVRVSILIDEFAIDRLDGEVRIRP